MLQPFTKYAGCGNDFIFFDHRLPFFPLEDKRFIQTLCHRQYGIGADGVILLENSSQADFRMRIFNADGSEAEMCGNGIRCLGKFIQELGYRSSIYRIETKQQVLRVHVEEEVSVEMALSAHLQWNIPLHLKEHSYQAHFLNTGVPHVVIFVKDLEKEDLQKLGPEIRYHPLFAPKGANVNLATWNEGAEIRIRTYERGVEGETLACGTGATAVALAAAYQHNLASPLFIQTASQERLRIDYDLTAHSQFSNITLTGPTKRIFQGQYAFA